MAGVEGASPVIVGPVVTLDKPASPMYLAYIRRLKVRRRMIFLSQLLLLAFILIIWEVAPRSHWVNPMLTSYPSALWAVFTTAAAETNIYYHTMITAFETIIGFTAAMIVGTLVAMLFWWSEFLYRMLDPFLVVANALPKVALLPIFFIFFGHVASIYAIGFAISIFVTIIMIYSGFREIPPNKIKLVRVFNASKLQILTKVVLPGSVPTMIATLKINVGLALVGVIVGEFQAGDRGLGSVIIYGSQIFAMDLVMAAVVILALISTALYMAVIYAEGIVMKHRR